MGYVPLNEGFMGVVSGLGLQEKSDFAVICGLGF